MKKNIEYQTWVKEEFIKTLHNGTPTTITNTGERFYKLVYDTLCKIYNIN